MSCITSLNVFLPIKKAGITVPSVIFLEVLLEETMLRVSETGMTF